MAGIFTALNVRPSGRLSRGNFSKIIVVMNTNISQLPSRHPKTDTLRRCLIVEDEGIISLDIEQIVNSYGLTTVHKAYTLAAALNLVDSNAYDIALLDLNVGSESTVPVAEILAARKTPFAVVTGNIDIPTALKGVPFVSKPFSEKNIINILVKLLPSEEGK
jgi:DNA-binding NtrC family response regulator